MIKCKVIKRIKETAKRATIVRIMIPLIDYLHQQFPDSSLATLRKWVKIKRILVNEIPAKAANQLVSRNMRITLQSKKKVIDYGIEILYEDQHLVIIYKPEGVLSVATAFQNTETVHAVIKARHPRAFPVHRLDRETSGIMVMALTEDARESLKIQFHQHSIERKYVAIVHGRLKGQGSWKCRLKEDSNYMVHPHPQGSEAITHYRVVKTYGKTTLVEYTLETGKKNQIRAQSLAAGFPILGDQKYGNSASKRLHLHAAYLSFIHPIANKQMKFSYPPPFAT